MILWVFVKLSLLGGVFRPSHWNLPTFSAQRLPNSLSHRCPALRYTLLLFCAYPVHHQPHCFVFCVLPGHQQKYPAESLPDEHLVRRYPPVTAILPLRFPCCFAMRTLPTYLSFVSILSMANLLQATLPLAVLISCHTNFTEGDHIPYEPKYNTRHVISAIADEICREIRRQPRRPKAQQKSVVHLLYGSSVGTEQRLLWPASPDGRTVIRINTRKPN